MKRLVVNAFRPADKVISRQAAKPAGEAAPLWPTQVIVDKLLHSEVGCERTADFTGVDW